MVPANLIITNMRSMRTTEVNATIIIDEKLDASFNKN